MATFHRGVRYALFAAATTAVVLMPGCGVLPGLPGDKPPPPAASTAPATPPSGTPTPAPSATPDDTLSSPMTDPEIGTARKLPSNLCDVLVASDLRRAGLGTAGAPRPSVIQGEKACTRAVDPGPTAISVTELPDSRLRQLQRLPLGPDSGLTKVAGNTAIAGCQYAVDLRANVCLLIIALSKDSWALVSWSGKTTLPTMGKKWDRYYPTLGARFPKA
jgi:hypothetical protein